MKSYTSDSRSRKKDYGSNYLKVADFCVTFSPKLNQFRGVLQQYLKCMENSINAEGAQAVDRYKSYKRYLLEFIDKQTYPKNGKFRHLVPLLRIVASTGFDPEVIRGIHTCCRYYDLFKASQKLVEKKRGEFITQFLQSRPQNYESCAPVAVEDPTEFNYFIVRTLIGALKASKTPVGEALSKCLPFKPVEDSIFLFRKGPAHIHKNKQASSKVSVPCIIGAPLDAWRHSQLRIYSRYKEGEVSSWDLIQDGMDLIGSMSFPEMRCKRLEIVPPTDPSQYDAKEPLMELVAFADKGYKVRCIRKASYYLQYILQPIHDSLMRILYSLPSDFTRSHDDGFKHLIHLTHVKGKQASCFDMSNATDAMPANYQRSILTGLYGEDIANLWWDLLTQHPNQYGYECKGQAMGAKSSWPAMALGNHTAVWFAAHKAGMLDEVLKNPQDYYIIVGDDIVIFDSILSQYYLMIMSQLGIPVNLSKSFIGSDSCHVTEFVKRNSWHGHEISAISPSLILKSYRDPGVCLELLRKLKASNSSDRSIDALVSLYTEKGSSLTRILIKHFRELPPYLGGINDSYEPLLTVSPKLRKFLTLARVGTFLKWRFSPPTVAYTGKDLTSEINYWLTQDVQGLKTKDTPIITYNRKTALRDNPLVNLLLQEEGIHQLDVFLQEEYSDEAAKSLLKRLAQQDSVLAGVPFYLRSDIEPKVQTSYSYRISKFYSNPTVDLDKLIKNEIKRISKMYDGHTEQLSYSADYYSSFFDEIEELSPWSELQENVPIINDIEPVYALRADTHNQPEEPDDLSQVEERSSSSEAPKLSTSFGRS